MPFRVMVLSLCMQPPMSYSIEAHQLGYFRPVTMPWHWVNVMQCAVRVR